MSDPRGIIGLSILGCGVVASFAHHILYFSTYSGTVLEISLSFIAPSTVVWTAIGVVVYVYRRELDSSNFGRIAVWYVGGGLVFGLAHYASLRSNLLVQPRFSVIQLSVVNWAIAGSFIGLLLGYYDVRRSRAVSEAVTRHREANRQARRLSVLIRILRHDIRNKLTVIVGHADLLEPTHGDESPEAIKRAAEALLDIANRVRELHRVTEGRTRQPVNLAECVSDCVSRARATYPEIQITTDLSDQSRAFTFPVIESNIYDLIENAVIHNDNDVSAVVIQIELRRIRRQDGAFIELVIADNGPGIPPLEEVIFDEEGETPLSHSLGTGLWLTRWVVEESNGSFDFATPPAGGTRMVIQLPTAP